MMKVCLLAFGRSSSDLLPPYDLVSIDDTVSCIAPFLSCSPFRHVVSTPGLLRGELKVDLLLLEI